MGCFKTDASYAVRPSGILIPASWFLELCVIYVLSVKCSTEG